VYYLSAYITGMAASRYRPSLESFLESRWPILAGLWLAALLTQFEFSANHGNYEVSHIFSTEKGWIDWLFLQKLLLCFALLGACRRFEASLDRRLHGLADMSFAIFFLHGYVLFTFRTLVQWQLPEGNIVEWLLLTAAALLLCMGIAWSARSMLGARSRHLLGY